jgi:GNAT superfamily N-acetyltransferase
MFWRMERAEFNMSTGEGRKAALKEMTCAGQVPGVLAYAGGQVAGWCSTGPRESYLALEKSRILKRIDREPVWSIVCFFVARAYRRSGMLVALLRGAVDYAESQGALIVEGYPIDLETPKLVGQKLKGDAGYMGVASAFRAAGFVEVARASETQLIMRYRIDAAEADPS